MDKFGATVSASRIGLTGFEPATSWSRTKRSTKLSYSPLFPRHDRFLGLNVNANLILLTDPTRTLQVRGDSDARS